MTDRDGLNRERARRFAWRLLRPEDALVLLEREEAQTGRGSGEGGAGTDADADKVRPREPFADALRGAPLGPEPPGIVTAADADEEIRGIPGDSLEPEDAGRLMHEQCAELAEAAEAAWALREETAQRRATALLAREAADLGINLTSIYRHARASVRMARLFVRHHARLSPSDRALADRALLWLPLDHEEVEDLFVEIAQAGNREYASLLRMAMPREDWGVGAFRPDFPERLLRILDGDSSWQSRLCALEWLEYAPAREAIPSVRRALREPHTGLRARAISFLIEVCSPPALTEDDARFLLEDLVAHPPPFDYTGPRAEAAERYAARLDAAIATVRPAGGAAILLSLLEHRDFRTGDPYFVCSSAWIVRVLAAAYPGEPETLAVLDRMLDSQFSSERYNAVEAAARLPVELARPRLLARAADGMPLVAERARDMWLKYLDGVCPVDELAGVPLALLDGPPSEQLRARLSVLRGLSDEARQAMVEVLFAEAPAPEALALLAFALGDDSLWLRRVRPHLPKDVGEYATRLLRRFGARGVRALCWLVERRPHSEGSEWITPLVDLLGMKASPIGPRMLPEIEALALRCLDHPAEQTCADGLRLLIALAPRRPPPLALRERVLAWQNGSSSASLPALLLLESWPADPALDALLVADLPAALAAGDYGRFAGRFALALRRKAPGLAELAEEVYHAWQPDVPGPGWQHDPAAHHAIADCMRLLVTRRKLPTGFEQALLAQPESPRFLLALGRVRTAPLTAPLRRLVMRALRSTAGDGLVAVQAAIDLLLTGALSPRSRHIRALIERVPRPQGVRLLSTLLLLKKVVPVGQPLLRSFLTDPDPEVAETMADCALTMRNLVSKRFLAKVRTQIPSRPVRNALELVLGIDDRSAFWQDGANDEG